MRMRGAAITEEQQAAEDEHLDVSVPPLEVRLGIVCVVMQFLCLRHDAWEARVGRRDARILIGGVVFVFPNQYVVWMRGLKSCLSPSGQISASPPSTLHDIFADFRV